MPGKIRNYLNSKKLALKNYLLDTKEAAIDDGSETVFSVVKASASQLMVYMLPLYASAVIGGLGLSVFMLLKKKTPPKEVLAALGAMGFCWVLHYDVAKGSFIKRVYKESKELVQKKQVI